MINIRLPNITAQNEREQIQQLKSYLHQLVGELNWALGTIESGGDTSKVVVKTNGSTVTKAEMATTFNELKSLIIKSSATVMAYAESAEEKYRSLYVAQSDFGSYTEEASQTIKKNSKNIESFYEDMQEIITDLDTLEHSLIKVNANIKSGLLYYDDTGVPVYGLEVGQRTAIDGSEVFNKFARFTADRLSFYDQNGTEVAYISDYKLYITNVEIKGSLKEGGYVDIITESGGIVTKWVGG